MKVKFRPDMDINGVIEILKTDLLGCFARPDEVEVEFFGTPVNYMRLKYGKFSMGSTIFFADRTEENTPKDPSKPFYDAYHIYDNISDIKTRWKRYMKDNSIKDEIDDFIQD